jgi:squalene-hopene/tetraprenyl-beta-curcumene cyclase
VFLEKAAAVAAFSMVEREEATMRRILGLTACLVAGTVGVCWRAESTAANLEHPETPGANSWNPKAAAAYLDQRVNWWMEWPKAARDHETFCVSCHTAVPYAMSRPALRGALGEQGLSTNERRLLENVKKRVRLWKEVAPFYTDADRGAYKTVESRGTESVLNALILASNDARRDRNNDSEKSARNGHISENTRAAFENMWAEQQIAGDKKGAWLWLRFKNEPWEADDSDYYGAALAAIAVGTAPENYRARREIQNNLKMLREYLNRECARQTLSNRVVLLWASAKVPGLIESERQKAIISEMLSKQQSDGGWSLSSLTGSWKRNDGTLQEAKSDGYATGLIVLALEEAGIPRDTSQLKQGLAWLASSQNKTQGSWLAYSLNKNEEHHISPDTARFMNDAATAYAVLALSDNERH